mgnify:CR=1 FL=1
MLNIDFKSYVNMDQYVDQKRSHLNYHLNLYCMVLVPQRTLKNFQPRGGASRRVISLYDQEILKHSQVGNLQTHD